MHPLQKHTFSTELQSSPSPVPQRLAAPAHHARGRCSTCQVWEFSQSTWSRTRAKPLQMWPRGQAQTTRSSLALKDQQLNDQTRSHRLFSSTMPFLCICCTFVHFHDNSLHWTLALLALALLSHPNLSSITRAGPSNLSAVDFHSGLCQTYLMFLYTHSLLLCVIPYGHLFLF